ncbi:hypothetical protein JMJ77_0012152 [Colletotrichum scovillei]|uniref:Uncharacterized protein n=1 Tax=Colletotrichum scovillei TaxID=1209932 RepID=A0A9P7QUF7_9PEZI|nr:hypothetical protein JMJ78_0001205 [Colletotrichum scovillei]KAG7041632.1 hypothetical protein JMJ77_0012152 [Colletotrichum scovillei]KAG7061659.1 hypothetical protein JMJ76_0003619 [Colletotrichum scovillei]
MDGSQSPINSLRLSAMRSFVVIRLQIRDSRSQLVYQFINLRAIGRLHAGQASKLIACDHDSSHTERAMGDDIISTRIGLFAAWNVENETNTPR